MAEMEDWAGLIEDTRMALTTFAADDLEALAARAEKMLESANRAPFSGRIGLRADVVAGHRVLGDLLHATAGNLDVLRRMRGEETGSRWDH